MDQKNSSFEVLKLFNNEFSDKNANRVLELIKLFPEIKNSSFAIKPKLNNIEQVISLNTVIGNNKIYLPVISSAILGNDANKWFDFAQSNGFNLNIRGFIEQNNFDNDLNKSNKVVFDNKIVIKLLWDELLLLSKNPIQAHKCLNKLGLHGKADSANNLITEFYSYAFRQANTDEFINNCVEYINSSKLDLTDEKMWLSMHRYSFNKDLDLEALGGCAQNFFSQLVKNLSMDKLEQLALNFVNVKKNISNEIFSLNEYNSAGIYDARLFFLKQLNKLGVNINTTHLDLFIKSGEEDFKHFDNLILNKNNLETKYCAHELFSFLLTKADVIPSKSSIDLLPNCWASEAHSYIDALELVGILKKSSVDLIKGRVKII